MALLENDELIATLFEFQARAHLARGNREYFKISNAALRGAN